MTNEKRPRGRPRGSEKKDDPYLAQVADLLIQNPSLQPTTAMKIVMSRSRSTWRETDETLIRRWQVKWKRRSQFFLAAARERARPRRTLRETIASIERFGIANVVEPPLLAAINRAAKDLQAAVVQTTALNQLVAQTKALQDLMTPSSQYLASMKALEVSMMPSAQFLSTIKAFQDSIAPSPQLLGMMKTLEDRMKNFATAAYGVRIAY